MTVTSLIVRNIRRNPRNFVFSSVGITRQKDGLTFKDVDYQGNRNLLEVAKHAGVKKFIYVSVFRGPEVQSVSPGSFSPTRSTKRTPSSPPAASSTCLAGRGSHSRTVSRTRRASWWPWSARSASLGRSASPSAHR